MQRRLISAILSRQENDVLACLTSGEDPNQIDKDGNTALIVAVSTPGVSEKIVLALLEHGADLFGVSDDELSALWYAAGEGGDRARLEVLLSHGAYANEIARNGRTAVTQACLCGDIGRLKLLVNHGGSAQATTYSDVSNGADFDGLVNLVPLFAAAQSGNLDCFRFIADRNTDPEYSLENQAILNYVGSVELGLFLIDEHSDAFPFLKSLEGDSFFDNLLTSLDKGHLFLAEAMILRMTNGQQAMLDSMLWNACRNDNQDGVKMLLRLGANPVVKLDGYGSPVWCALSWNSLTNKLDVILKELIAHGFDINEPLPNGDYPIHLAVKGEYVTRFLETLIRNSAGIDVQDAKGKTALIIAAERDDFEVVECLISHGAHPDIRDHRNKTALHYAISNLRSDKFFSKLFRVSQSTETAKIIELLKR